MTKKELLKALDGYDDDTIVVCRDEDGGWDNIQRIEPDGCSDVSPFSVAVRFRVRS